VRPARLRWWAEATVVAALYELFEIVRASFARDAGTAQRHARTIVAIERWMRLFPEPALNRWVAAHKSLAQTMDIYYGTLHFVGPPLVLVWLWRRHPGSYARWRNILIVTTVASLALFWLYPLAPPRLFIGAGAHLVDTSIRFGGLGPLDRGNFVDHNPYAAMPSLHIAWAAWCAWALIGSSTGRGRRTSWWSLVYPAVTTVVVIGTANHWLLDAVGGVVLVGAGVLGAEALDQLRLRQPKRGILVLKTGSARPAAADHEEVRTPR
jgi:hypothetical protein